MAVDVPVVVELVEEGAEEATEEARTSWGLWNDDEV